MPKTTKRIYELEVGDIVIFPYCKGVSTISKIEKVSKWEFQIFFEGIRDSARYGQEIEVTYLGKKEEKKMVPNSDYSGSRLISYKFGLVADHPLSLPYSVPYYLKLVFKKGDKIMTDIWCAKNQSFEYLPYLNRIVDRKEGDFKECTYYFTDGSLIAIS